MDISLKYGFCDDCTLIRQEVFIREQGFKEEFDEKDKVAEHVVVYCDGKPAGTGRVFPSDNKDVFIIGRVAVLPQYRSMGIGAVVVKSLMERAKEKGAKQIEISSQLQAEGFYKKLGFTSFGSPYYEEHCPHIRMKTDL